ncbi:MAG: beta-ketoacyl synthase N-terminal-like domain-containing protein [Trichloromonas sp.]|jgi:3-oxoacyl-[acyl-carrier-protein] synthase II|nr:beta-ketoacyl synthase N-terminal-like domain-containing protein [Trichloromonas sp.]
MLSARITGIGWVSAQGFGWGGQGGAFALSPGEPPTLSRAEVFDQPDRRFGRMDAFSRLGLAAVTFALRDAGLEEWREKRPIGLIAATAYGCLATDRDYFATVIPDGGALASPQLFAYTLSNTFLGEAALRFGLSGEALVVSEPPPGGGLAPLGLALENLAWEPAPAMVAGLCDLAPSEGLPALPGLPPGAIFVVLERVTREGSLDYGELRRDDDGLYRLNNAPVADLADLVTRGLARSKGGANLRG